MCRLTELDREAASHEDFIAILLRLTGLRAVVVGYHRRRVRAAEALMKRFDSDSRVPVWCSERFRHHQRALLGLGFLMEREFALARRVISGPESYRAFCALMRARFPDGGWSCAASGRRIIVTAPRSQIPEWERFLVEYDQAA
jgi:hypothetical protein